jgi:hypothetical protein
VTADVRVVAGPLLPGMNVGRIAAHPIGRITSPLVRNGTEFASRISIQGEIRATPEAFEGVTGGLGSRVAAGTPALMRSHGLARSDFPGWGIL